MKVGGIAMRTIRALPARDGIEVIDQRALPHRLLSARLDSPQAVFTAIREMWVRGAPLIGASAAYGIALQMNRDTSDRALEDSADLLRQARPTAVNLAWAIERLLRVLRPLVLLARNVMPPGPKPMPSPRRTSPSTARSASMVWRCCARSRRAGPGRYGC